MVICLTSAYDIHESGRLLDRKEQGHGLTDVDLLFVRIWLDLGLAILCLDLPLLRWSRAVVGVGCAAVVLGCRVGRGVGCNDIQHLQLGHRGQSCLHL